MAKITTPQARLVYKWIPWVWWWFFLFLFFISSYLNIVKIYVECCEGLREGFVSPWQPAQSLCSVRLHGVIWLRAAAHWAADLSSRKHGETAHLCHTHPVCNNRDRVWTRGACTRITFWKDCLALIVSLSLLRTHTHSEWNSERCWGLPVVPADLQTLNSHTKHCGSSWDDLTGYRLFLEFILSSL